MTDRPLAIVTGGRRGIGLGIAKALAEAGFDLVVTGVGPAEDAAGAVSELMALGAGVEYVQSDLADLDAHEAVMSVTKARLAPISCLVNNAGIPSVVRGDFLDLLPENFDRVMNTNLRGTIFFTQAVVRSMLDNPSSHPRTVVNVGSVSAVLTSPERLDYCTSKAGLASFSKGLAVRLADEGISVFEVRPGIVRSDMTAGVSEKYDRLIGDGLVPVRRWGEASDIGTIVADLASGRFSFATGSVIDADGGLSIGRL